MKSEFNRVKLSEIADITDSLHKSPVYSDSGYPMVRVTDIRAGSLNLSNTFKVTEEVFQEFTSKYKPVRGDVIFTRVGSYGLSCYVATDEKFCLGQNTVVISPIAEERFLYYTLQSRVIKNQIESAVVGSTQKTISLKSIKNLDIPFPPLPTQKTIAHILSTLDDKIELNRKMNQTLESMAQAIFKSWFVDFDPVHAKAGASSEDELDKAAKDLGISREVLDLFPSEFEESELGLIPKGWEVYPIGKVSSVKIGKTPPRKESEWFSKESGIKWASIKDMGNAGVYIIETSEYLTNEAILRFNIKKIPRNTVILSFKLTIGRVSITSEEMSSNEAIAQFSLNEPSKVTSEFLYCYLKMFNYSLLGSTSSIATAINSKIVRTIPVLIDDTVMHRFHSLVEPLFKKIKGVQDEIQTLQKTRDTLLPKLLSGELDVSNLNLGLTDD